MELFIGIIVLSCPHKILLQFSLTISTSQSCVCVTGIIDQACVGFFFYTVVSGGNSLEILFQTEVTEENVFS